MDELNTPKREFWLGYDPGKINDFAALSIIEHTAKVSIVSYLKRLPLGMSYPQQTLEVKSIMDRPILKSNNTHLIADGTGVGIAVYDLCRKNGLNPISLTITGGARAVWSKSLRHVRVPKEALIGCLLTTAQNGELKIAKNLEATPVLTQELQSFQSKLNPKTAHASFGAWREGAHDDLVLSVAISLWVAMNKPAPRFVSRYISVGGRR